MRPLAILLGPLFVVSACSGNPPPSTSALPQPPPPAAPASTSAAGTSAAGAGTATTQTPVKALSAEELKEFVECYGDCTLLKPLTPAAIAALDARASTLENARFIVFHAEHLPGLGALGWIRKLTVIAAEPVDFAPIAKLTKLESLLFTAPAADHLDSLRELRDLEVLNLSVSNLKALEPLGALTKLQTLVVAATAVEDTDLAALAPLTELTALELTGGPAIKDASTLRKLPKLQTVSLYGTPLADVSSFGGHPTITKLVVSIDPKGKLDGLETFPKLEWLVVRDMLGLKDASGVAKAKGLTTLELIDLGITKLPSLAPLKKLRSLVLQQNDALTDLGGVSGAPELNELSIDGSPVAHLGALSGLKKLARIDLRNTSVKDLAPLAKIKSLRVLRVHGPTPDAFAFRKLRPDVDADNSVPPPSP